MADLHIEDFFRDVAKIFILLYAAFPRKTILYVEDVSGADEPDEFGLHHPRFQAAFSAMVWLGEHGYLHFQDTIRDEALDQVVLSQRGFLLLTTRSELGFATADSGGLPARRWPHRRRPMTQVRAALQRGCRIWNRRCIDYLLRRRIAALFQSQNRRMAAYVEPIRSEETKGHELPPKFADAPSSRALPPAALPAPARPQNMIGCFQRLQQ